MALVIAVSGSGRERLCKICAGASLHVGSVMESHPYAPLNSQHRDGASGVQKEGCEVRSLEKLEAMWRTADSWKKGNAVAVNDATEQLIVRECKKEQRANYPTFTLQHTKQANPPPPAS